MNYLSALQALCLSRVALLFIPALLASLLGVPLQVLVLLTQAFFPRPIQEAFVAFFLLLMVVYFDPPPRDEKSNFHCKSTYKCLPGPAGGFVTWT